MFGISTLVHCSRHKGKTVYSEPEGSKRRDTVYHKTELNGLRLNRRLVSIEDISLSHSSFDALESFVKSSFCNTHTFVLWMFPQGPSFDVTQIKLHSILCCALFDWLFFLCARAINNVLHACPEANIHPIILLHSTSDSFYLFAQKKSILRKNGHRLV